MPLSNFFSYCFTLFWGSAICFLFLPCNLHGPLQESFSPSGPKSKNSRKKRFPRPWGQKRLKKVEKRSTTSQKQPFFNLFQPFFNLFSTFSDPGARPREISGPKGPNDTCKGPGDRNFCLSFPISGWRPEAYSVPGERCRNACF